MNPDDFAQSVENIFHLSFLIRDGKVALETGEEGDPMEGQPIICMRFCPIAPCLPTNLALFEDICDPPTDANYADGLKKRQVVLEFDMSTWEVRRPSDRSRIDTDCVILACYPGL